jgi:mRNA interferase RelE/StbE
VVNYKLIIARSAAKEIEGLPKQERVKIVAKIQGLASNPRPPGCEKLAGDDKYRIRHGDYRILYTISDPTVLVTVVRVAHRREVYR